MDSPSRSRKIARGLNACQRCRRRKQKCDLKYPSCSNCEGSNAPCLTYDLGKGAEIPRNYVSSLEAQIERLTRELEDLKACTPSTSADTEDTASTKVVSRTIDDRSSSPEEVPATSDRGSAHVNKLITSVRNVVVEPSRQPRFLGQSSGITLAKLVMAVIKVDDLPPPFLPEQRKQSSLDPSSSTPAAEASLPPRQAADHLVQVYFQYRTPHLPIISRSRVEEAVNSAYSWKNGNQPLDRIAEKNLFITFMIFAIALCDLPNPAGSGRPIQNEGCFSSAITWVENIITYSKSDIDTLRAILLLTQFVALCPSRGSLWHLAGTALRYCVDIGLHWETEEQALSMDADLLYERRCLWYSTYQFDRVLCITLGRPFGILDESTRVPLPNPWMRPRRSLDNETNELDIHCQRAHNHMFSMSKLESEIRHVQHSQTWSVKIAYPRPNYSAWIHDIEPRLQEWYSTIPQSDRAHPTSIFAQQAYWDAVYYNAVLLLYCPNSTIPPSSETLFLYFEACCKVIASIKILQREGKIDVMWKSVHQLFMAGLGVIYGLWQAKEVRDRNPVRTSISTLQSCASTLSAMSETFSGASDCRDVFDTLSSATIDWLVTNDAEEMRQSQLSFEKQVQDLFQGFQPSKQGFVNNDGGDYMSSMLSADNFAFSEMLSSAAQWPEFEDMGFGLAGLDSMQGVDSMQVAEMNTRPYLPMY